MTNNLTDRVTGVFLLLFAIWYGYQATHFKVTFMADPVGPKALPIILAGIMAVLSLYLIVKPDANPEWPPAVTWLRIAIIILIFIVYAYLLVPVGFVLATTFVMSALAILFRGPWLKSLAASLIFSLLLYGLFAMLLDLSLPTGWLFRGLTG
ncbi:MAG: tripartite tricarboxylate transporter TctB family protein [Anaerolineaceae bacterium]|nr:tripartite tricarboxylate transporter TctB family protein [Anaerolineaceae bacterium]